MPKGYWIARVDVDDLDTYMSYVKANGAVFDAYGARFIVRGGDFETPEGSSRSRNIVLEFPSYQAARDCYHSAQYQTVKEIRDPVSTSDLIIIEGYDG